MLVSQYIYTACGKDRNGAFSVFSKTNDITDAECAEIRDVMMYKTPSGLPFEPTDQEIEEKFPKKFGYFFLSSGRVCLSQVCYVGRVYSDNDTRWGNYIIHAFVFEKSGILAPYSFIEDAVFKRILTRKEWHDDAIPDDLQKKEIPESGSMQLEEVINFFTEDRRDKLKYLIESFINSTSDNPVSFNDDFKNIKYWFKMLSLCLPKEMQNKTSVCSHFTNTIAPGNASSRIQVRVNRAESSQFNYSQDAQRGRYAFDFQKNIMPASVKFGKYAGNIIKLLSSGVSDVENFVDKINKILISCPVDINEASDLLNIYQEDYANFENNDEILNSVLLADRVSYETEFIANNFWVKKSQFNFNANQKLQIYGFIYKNVPAASKKNNIIEMVLNNAAELGICIDNAVGFRDDLKLKAGFIFDGYYDYIKAIGLDNYIEQTQNSFVKIFVLFDHIVNLHDVKNSLQANNNQEERKALYLIMSAAFKRQSISDIDLLINSANSSISNLGAQLLSVIVKKTVDSEIKPLNIQFSFEILRRLQPQIDIAFEYLLHLIKIASSQDEFIKAYINAERNIPEMILKFENVNKNESIIKDFCNKKNAYLFMSQPLSLQGLKEYFNKFYLTGADTGIFVKRLSEYLCGIQAEKKAGECINILNVMKFPPNTDMMFLLPVYIVILNAVFSLPYDNIYALCGKKDYFEKLYEIFIIVKNNGGGLKQEIQEMIILTHCGNILEKYNFKAKNQNLISFYSKTQEEADEIAININKLNSGMSMNIFTDYYIDPVVNLLIFGAAAANQIDYDGTLEKAFKKIIEEGNIEKIAESVIYGIKHSKAKPILFILYIFRKCLMPSSKLLDKRFSIITEKCFEKLSPGDRRKIFNELKTKADKSEAALFQRYFDEFNKTHKRGGFF